MKKIRYIIASALVSIGLCACTDTWDSHYSKWDTVIENTEIDLENLRGTSDMKKIKDLKGRPLLLFINSWSVGMTLERNEGLVLSEFGRD